MGKTHPIQWVSLLDHSNSSIYGPQANNFGRHKQFFRISIKIASFIKTSINTWDWQYLEECGE